MTDRLTGKWYFEEDHIVFECECGFKTEDARLEDKEANSWSKLADHAAEKHGINRANIAFSTSPP